MLFNINTLQWDEEILEELDIPRCMLPDTETVQLCLRYGGSVIFRWSDSRSPVQREISSPHCLGRPVLQAGEAKNTYGTGCFLLMNTGEKPVFSENGLVTTIAWGLDGKVNYALEGSIFVAGAAIQWLRDEHAPDRFSRGF